MEAGALPPLVALLQSGADKAKQNAALALAIITCDAALRPRVVAGALPPLIALLQMGTVKAKEYAAAALHNITCEAVLRAPVVEAGALPPLVALLQSGTDEATEHAAGVLSGIACEAALRPRVVEAGALPSLVALLQTGTDEATEHAAYVLAALAKEARFRSDLIGYGAVLQLAALSADALAPAATRERAEAALGQLCPSTAEWRRAVGESVAAVLPPLRAQAAAAGARARELRALADGAGCASAAHCDVTFRCADGTELGASRFLLAHASSYYSSLFESSSAEVASGVVAADPDFSSAAHGALLRQLHSLGEAPLPDEADTVLELLKLAAKLQPPAGSSAARPPLAPSGRALESAPPLERVLARCEAALIGGLDVFNCLDMLLHVKAGGSFPRIVEAAEALMKDRLHEVVAQPRWAQFRAEFPGDAASSSWRWPYS